MDQAEILNHLSLLHKQGYAITDVDWTTGTISVKPPAFPVDRLTADEHNACGISLVDGIKAVRNNRNMTLRDAKEFVQKHHVFEPNIR